MSGVSSTVSDANASRSNMINKILLQERNKVQIIHRCHLLSPLLLHLGQHHLASKAEEYPASPPHPYPVLKRLRTALYLPYYRQGQHDTADGNQPTHQRNMPTLSACAVARKSLVGEKSKLVAMLGVRKASIRIPVGISNVRIMQSTAVATSHRASDEKAFVPNEERRYQGERE